MMRFSLLARSWRASVRFPGTARSSGSTGRGKVVGAAAGPAVADELDGGALSGAGGVVFSPVVAFSALDALQQSASSSALAGQVACRMCRMHGGVRIEACWSHNW